MLLAFCLLFYSFSSSQLVWAETTTSPDIVVTEDDVVLENSSCPEGQDSSYIMTHPDGSAMIGFGNCVNTFAVTLAINEALTASGVSIDAINYSWRYANGCFNTTGGSAGVDQWCKDNIEDRVDTTTGEVLDGEYADQFDVLTVKVIVTDANGDIVEERLYTYDTWFDFENSNAYSDEEFYEEDMGFYWQVQRDSIRFWNSMTGEGTIYSPDQLGNITFRAQSVDGAYWEGGAFGPLVTAGTINFTYRPNPCANNTLFDPSCPGYAEAYAQQEYDNNCQANPLYDPGCPGYSAAYQQQQYDNACAADPLYDSGCPGYQQAYYDQQCSADPLYDSGCPGYDAAMLEQQCAIDSHYSSDCPNYYWANLEGTSSIENVAGQGSDFIEILKAHNGNLWKILYYNSMEINAGEWVAVCHTYDDGCEDAVITGVSFQQNGMDFYAFLYTKDTDGNTFIPTNGDKYKFMTTNRLSNICNNIDPMYSQFCDGYEEASAEFEYEQQCQANPLYDSGCAGYDEAYYDYQCQANPLYDAGCPGYDTAYYNYQCDANPLYDSGCPGYDTAYYNQQCELDPLYAETCPGYEQAYLTQQCEADPLYDTQCSGYQEAYYNQQCSLDPLYDSGCPGYETAYYNQQCSLSPLYDSGCAGYDEAYYTQQCEISPLYDSGCPGYEGAYFTQQCELDALYSPQCDGYDTAYFNQQCSLDTLYDTQCPGYAEAYFTYQCSLDALYDQQCNGYDDAFYLQQCTLDALYDSGCDGYEAAFTQQQFELQCSLDALYDPLCNGYAEALAEQQAQEQSQDVVDDPVINTITPEPVEVIVIVQEPVVEPVVVEQPVIEVEFDETIDEPEVTTETVVEDIIEDIDTTEEQTTNEEIEQEATPEEDGETSQENVESTSGTEEEESGEVETEDNPQDTGTQTTRQLTPAQKKAAKEKKIKELIVQRLKNLAKEMGEAKSLEAQRDVQNYIIALLGFKVGFDAYRTEIPENYYYDDRDINGDKKVPENNRGLRNGLAQEILHEKMVDEQYKDMD